jgi:4'-phosphopantetheinyl transferase
VELRENDIHLYLTDPGEGLDPGLLERYSALLSDDEKLRMSRFYSAAHRRRFLLTRALIRTTLSRYCDVEPGAWVFEHNPYEKPEIAFPAFKPPIRFNLSHCDGLIICALTRTHDIGVDAEDSRRSTNTSLERLASYFSRREIEDLVLLPEHQRQSRFFDYWTLKEAYIKARGKGLAIPLSSFSFVFEQGRLAGFEAEPETHPDPANWQFWRLALDGRLRIAIAVNSGTDAFQFSSAKVVPLASVTNVTLESL